MVDKRTARLMHATSFRAALEEQRSILRQERLSACTGAPPIARRASSTAGAVASFVRKRPLLPAEEAKGDYDVLSVEVSVERDATGASGPTGNAPGCVVAHACMMKPDLVRMFVRHTAFVPSGGAMDEHAGADEVYGLAAAPLIEHAMRGGHSTLFTYGQTGSGKTFTLEQIFSRATPELAGRASCGARGSAYALRVSAVEVIGRRCVDLISRCDCQVLTTADGGLELKGALLETVSSEAQLSQLLSRVFAARATEATAGNSTSSRSHMIVSIDVPPPRADVTIAQGAPTDAPGLGAPADAVRFGRSSRPALVGRVTLVDCAGSEWAADSAIHCKSRQREGAEINTSLHALKQCVRAFSERTRTGRPVRMPFRDSMLTRLLADSFQGSASPSDASQGSCRLAVLGCVSPTSAATEHSISTLRTVMELAGAAHEAASWTTPVRRVRSPGEPDWPPPGGSWFGCSC